MRPDRHLLRVRGQVKVVLIATARNKSWSLAAGLIVGVSQPTVFRSCRRITQSQRPESLVINIVGKLNLSILNVPIRPNNGDSYRALESRVGLARVGLVVRWRICSTREVYA
ncbi:hypothetical protein [Actinomyces ruminis]|uniref:Uncharacterized protein n=1 Tax=Actinomyces ruminis TaxID=1937003 RepID=A0ABX4MCN2_9ACTO|nr:hypothetical protein [Actinomyces ruminis]PHP51832.1 hypothetical protein BW737_014290 [Actinomyces ruminis]